MWCGFLGIKGYLLSEGAQLAVGQLSLVAKYRQNFVEFVERSERGTILELAKYTRPRLATDPWDKIYSLASVATDAVPLPYPPNYNISANMLYSDFAAWTIT